MKIAREETSRLAELLRREHHALADFLLALSEFDRRQLWSQLGYASLFDHLRRELGLSKAAAFYRLTAARLIQNHPEVIEPLRDGRLCFSSIIELSKVLTAENRDEVLPRFFHLSKREAQDVRAELAPSPVVPRRAMVTTVPAGRTAPTTPVLPAEGAPPLSPLALAAPPATALDVDVRQAVRPGEPPSPDRALVVEPKTAVLSRIHLTVPRRLLEKLAAARDALSHSHPGATEETILELGLDLIIERHRKRRGIGAKPRTQSQPPTRDAPPRSRDAPPRSERSRHVPAAVWRAVWERDQGCCAWPLEGGGVCASTYQVELDHVDGWALGAATTVEETRLLCRVHQLVSARRLYGDALVNAYTKPRGGSCSEAVAAYGAVDAGGTRLRSPSGSASADAPRSGCGPKAAALGAMP